jgi:AraC-like DNA-binding protein
VDLLSTDDVRVARFDCAPDDRRWRETNWIGPRSHVVLPGPPVWIGRAGSEQRVADRSMVVLYNADEEYSRRLLDPTGDHSLYVELSPRALEAVAGTRRFTRSSLPVTSAAWATTQLLPATIAAADDEESAEARVLEALMAVLAPLRTEPTEDGSSGQLERVRSLLALDVHRPLRLRELAAEAHLSPFHLVRWFKRATGTTPIAYRGRLRARAAAADVLARTDTCLADLAHDAGYASHSHLSTAVRREFGPTPSALRLAGSLPGQDRRTAG